MELYVRRLPSMPWHLFYLLILTACCASLLPCSVCLDNLYEICQNTGSTCGNMSIRYPFGVGNRGCGLPGLQIDCVHNSSPVIEIDGRSYIILKIFYDTNNFIIFRNVTCRFLDDPINIGSGYADSVFRLESKTMWNINVFKCNKFIEGAIQGQIRQCNASVYYSLSWDNPSAGYSLRECTYMPHVRVEVGKMEWVSSDTHRNKSCSSCQTSGGICGYNISNSAAGYKISDSTAAAPFVCYCKDGSRNDKYCSHGKKLKNGVAIGVSAGAAVLIAAGLLVAITVYKARKGFCFGECFVVSGVRDNEGKDLEAAVRDKIGTLPIFSYEVLKQATDDFDEKNQLGDGGFGSVYLGKLRDSRAVAVKRLYDNSRRVQQFINEVQILSNSYHPNLVRLYGCTSPEGRDLLLVYEYVPNGTLEDHLHGKRKKDKGLNWDTRLKICIETARGLAFLHCLEPPIFHRDVKSPNILLDEDLHVKVADFGLSRFVPLDASHVSTAPQGTPGYVDPEYYECFQLTDKSDVYSFGVVLMEIISAKLAVDINRCRREIVLANMAIAKIQAGALDELIDPNLEIDSNPDIKVMVTAVANLAFRCLAPEKEDRPDMKGVLAELEQIKQNGSECKNPAYHPSPISVHEKWPSTLTTPQNSASTVQSL